MRSIGFLFAGAMLGSLNGGCRRATSPPTPPAGSGHVSIPKEGVTLEHANFEYRNAQGQLLWTAQAKSGSGTSAEKQAELRDVKCVLYSEGKPTWNCQSQTLLADEPTKQVKMSGNVTGHSTDGERSFTVPSATWNVKAAMITGGPNVTLRVQRARITGDRLEASTKDQTGRVIGHIRGTFTKS